MDTDLPGADEQRTGLRMCVRMKRQGGWRHWRLTGAMPLGQESIGPYP